MKRFYKHVTLEQSEAGWQVLLDGKPIRTPHKNVLAMPTQGLAELVRAEWDAVEETINPKAMHHTGLAHAAIDALPTQRVYVIDELAKFGETDLLYYRAPEEALALKQRTYWDPVLDWARETYAIEFVMAEGIMPVAQPEATIACLRAEVEKLEDWRLAGFTLLVHKLGSLVLAIALLHGRLDTEQAIACAQLDESHQAETWGVDEEGKARLDALCVEIHEAAQFIQRSVD